MNGLFHRRLTLTVLLLLSLAFILNGPAARLAQAQEIASVEQLKTEAFKALRGGQFDRTTELLSRAASLSTDPSLPKMVLWTKQFDTQRQGFLAERRQQYDKTVANVQLLLKNAKRDQAMDLAARAYLLADDKKAFGQEPWVRTLVTAAAKDATGYEQSQQWLRASRLYFDLSTIEPATPEWKDQLKLSARRVRLQALYTPEVFKEIQQSKVKEDDEVERLLNPTTRPATKPATQASDPDDEKADNGAIDWRDSVKGIQYDMLGEALEKAQKDYYREITYRALMAGGINGLKAMLTTNGLEKAFPTLGDQPKRDEFLKALDDGLDKARAATNETEQTVLSTFLAVLRTANRNTVRLPEEVLTNEFADGALGVLDPFTSMIWPSDQEDFTTATKGEFSGVGIQIERDADGSLKVVSPLEDTPAYKAGIKAGDVITHVDGKMVKGISLNQAVKKIKGPTGTPVSLTVRSLDGTVKDYPLRRDTIKVGSIKGWLHKPGGGWDYMVDPAQKIAFVRLTNFTSTSSQDLDKAMAQMHQDGAKGMILDLRSNPGGLLTSATDIVDKFIKEGVIVSTHPDRDTPNQSAVIKAKGDGAEAGLPLVVLVNQLSASASEIVSGALKDHHRALIVGDRTFGKGSVQMLFSLSNHAAYLKLTTSHYYLPNGRCIHREENSTEWGVDPDLTVEMTPEQMRAVMDARQEMDVLRDARTPGPGNPLPLQTQPEPKVAQPPATGPTTASVKKDLLAADPQLSAALLLLRLQLAGAQL